MEQISLLAPAKLNLSLDIVGVREDGYHLMQMVMQTVSLYDEVSIEKNDTGDLRVNCAALPLQEEKDNIAYRAATAFFDDINSSHRGVTITIKKNIPFGAGMGGGSADGAAVLVGLNSLYRAELSEQALMKIGEGVGADIPFCLYGGTALVEGIGEQITPVADFPLCYFVVAKPMASVNTKSAFEAFDQGKIRTRPNTDELLCAIKWQDILTAAGLFCNVFEETVQLDEIAVIKEQMRLCGGLNPVMTGSGSAVFSLFLEEEPAIACYYRLCEQGIKAYVCEPVKTGPRILL